MKAPRSSIEFYTGVAGERFEGVTLERVIDEGYATGELIVRGLTLEHLQKFADWCLTLPAEDYARFEAAARGAERYLVREAQR